MSNISAEVSTGISSAMRQFNDDLIYEFRKRKVLCIPEYLDSAFRQTVAFFNNQLKYVGYRTLTPEERLDLIFQSTIRAGYVSVKRTETATIRFEFEFQGDPYYIHIEVPYLKNNCVVCNDTKYYPLFPIVERGGVNVTDKNTIIVKVMRIPITFGRRPSDRMVLEAVSGNQYWDLLVTVKIYQGATTSKGDQIPLILYPLCRLGFVKAMDLYNVPRGSITVTDAPDFGKEEHEYFILPNGLYLRADKELLRANIYYKRVVLSLFQIFTENTLFTIADVIGEDTEYYCTTLGRYIGTKNRDSPMNRLILKNAWTHLDTTDLMLDGVAKKKLASVGIVVDNIYDLLHYMFFNIDRMIVSYNPIDLYNKMIGSLDQLMGGIIRYISKKQYKIINSKRGANLTPDVIKSFCKSASHSASWVRTTGVFKPEPQASNDNELLTVSGKRYLSLDSVESQVGTSKKTSAVKTPTKMLCAHPSQIVVTTLLDIPSSKPLATGSINPHLHIDEEGNILKPAWASEIEHVFD